MKPIDWATIATSKGDINVPVYWKGDRFCVTKIVGQSFSVTHIKTGLRFRQLDCDTIWDAIEAAKTIDAQPIYKALNILNHGEGCEIPENPFIAPLIPRMKRVLGDVITDLRLKGVQCWA